MAGVTKCLKGWMEIFTPTFSAKAGPYSVHQHIQRFNSKTYLFLSNNVPWLVLDVWMYFRMSVGQFKALLQILVPRLRRQSTKCWPGAMSRSLYEVGKLFKCLSVYLSVYVMSKGLNNLCCLPSNTWCWERQVMNLSAVVVNVTTVGDRCTTIVIGWCICSQYER